MRLVTPQPDPRPPRGPFPSGAENDAHDSPEPANQEHVPARLNESEREALLLNIDVSLRVHARPQLFSWVQGALQSLIAHEVLLCGLQEGRQTPLRVDSFSTAPVDAARLNELYQQDVSLVPHLIKLWEENRCQAVSCDTDRGPHAGGALARELARIGVPHVLAHGTHDAAGNMTSFFVFCARPGTLGSKQAYLADVIVPYVHAAWVRSQVTWPLDRAGTKPAKTGLLTPREQQILQWIYHGKSNIEIGMILDISPLTVKNHVQKTLRKLNVLNRTQAVGKALALRIVNP
ncbi:MAG TPA: XrtB/PEP-CTERM-associated transcriptional regulator EpsA [Usitatibacter sp.]|nr:XrtB/PEP-CTERM-associated transcriptional regulator EpsA [Usitatibacter sp.]